MSTTTAQSLPIPPPRPAAVILPPQTSRRTHTEVPGRDVRQGDQPTEVMDDRLWLACSPVDPSWTRAASIDVMVDVAEPSDERDIDAVVSHVVESVHGGRRVLVACTDGRNRSGMVAALTLRELFGLGGADAVRLVRARHRGALSDSHLREYLDRLGPPAA